MVNSKALLPHLTCLSGLLTTVLAAYQLQDAYNTTNFFQGWDFFSGNDPTNGFVQYQAALPANSLSLAGFANNAVYLGVDSTTKNPAGGRKSVRVSSRKTYSSGLFVADIAHMPQAQGCGLWPAYWSFGTPWPAKGEVDIIEGVNSATTATFTLHTGPGCSVARGGDCNKDNGLTGCSQASNDTRTYGEGFNAIGGGVFAHELSKDTIKIWHFPRGASSTPGDLTSGSPDPSRWGAPAAVFSGCDVASHFADQRLVFNVDFCGDWAGRAFGSEPACKALGAASCEAYVAANPQAFREAYWLINSVKVYQQANNKKRTPPAPGRSRVYRLSK